MTAINQDATIARITGALKAIASLHGELPGVLQPPVGNIGPHVAEIRLGLAYEYRFKPDAQSAHDRRRLARVANRITQQAEELDAALGLLLPGTDLCWTVIPPSRGRKQARAFLGLGHARARHHGITAPLEGHYHLEEPTGGTTTLINTAIGRWKAPLKRLAALPWGTGTRAAYVVSRGARTTLRESDIPHRTSFVCQAGSYAHAVSLAALHLGDSKSAETHPALNEPPHYLAALSKAGFTDAEIALRARHAVLLAHKAAPDSADMTDLSDRIAALRSAAAVLPGYESVSLGYDLQSGRPEACVARPDTLFADADRAAGRAALHDLEVDFTACGDALRAAFAEVLPDGLSVSVRMAAAPAGGATPTSMSVALHVVIEQVRISLCTAFSLRRLRAILHALKEAGETDADPRVHAVLPPTIMAEHQDPRIVASHDSASVSFCRATHPAQALVLMAAGAILPQTAVGAADANKHLPDAIKHHSVARAEPATRAGIAEAMAQVAAGAGDS